MTGSSPTTAAACLLHEWLQRDGVAGQEELGLDAHGGRVFLFATTTELMAKLEKKVRGSRAYRAHPAPLVCNLIDGHTCA